MSSSKIIQLVVFSALLVLSDGFNSFNQAIADGEDKSRSFTLSDVKGRYAFSFNGEIMGLGSVAAAGYIKSDGKGNIFEAERTIMISALGTATTETFTCTYTINSTGKGSSTCTLDSPVPGFPAVETFDYVMEENGKAFRLVGTSPGVVIIGGGHR